MGVYDVMVVLLFFQKYTAYLLRRIIKSVHPCTLLMANFGKAEISLLFKPAASVPLLKILNVSERTGMSVVPRSSQFVPANWLPKNEQGGSFLGVPAVLFFLTPCIYAVSFQKCWFKNIRHIYCVASLKVYIRVYF